MAHTPQRRTVRTSIAPGHRGAPVGQAGRIERAAQRNLPTAPRIVVTKWGLTVGGWRAFRRYLAWCRRWADMSAPAAVGILVWIVGTVFVPISHAGDWAAVLAVVGLIPAHQRLGPHARHLRYVWSEGKAFFAKLRGVGGIEPLPTLLGVVKKQHVWFYDVRLEEGTEPKLWMAQRGRLTVVYGRQVDFIPINGSHFIRTHLMTRKTAGRPTPNIRLTNMAL